MSQSKAQLLDPQGDFTLTGQLIGVGATFSGNVSIAGTLTKQDVTNVDSIGVITARNRIDMTQGYQLGWKSGSTERARIHGDSGSNFIIETGATPTERLRIASSGRVGVGTASPRAFLDLCGAAENATLLLDSNDANSNLCLMDNSGSVRFLNYGGEIALRTGGTGAFTGDNERLRVDSSGRVLISHAASRNVGNITAKVQIEGTGSDASLSIIRNSNNPSSPYISLAKSRAGSVGGNTAIQDGDVLGKILFSGADGTDVTNNSASISGAIDGTPGGNDTPGRLVFETTADGGTSPTERLRIGSSGQIGIAGANYGTAGQVLASGGSGAAPSWTTISAAPEIEGTASGAITAHKSCVVNANGTISQVFQTVVPATTAKQDTELTNDGTYFPGDVKWLSSDKFIMVGRKINDTDKGRYFFGSVTSGGAITLTNSALWTGVTNQAWNTRIALDSSTNKFVVLAQLDGDNDIYMRSGEVNSGGTDIDWESANWWGVGNGQKSSTIATDNNGGYMIAYRRGDNNMHFRHVQLNGSGSPQDISAESSWTYYNTNNGDYANGENKITMDYVPSVGAYWCVLSDYNRFYYSPNGIWLVGGGYFRACWVKSNGTGSAPTLTLANQTVFAGAAGSQDAGTLNSMGYDPRFVYDPTSGKGILAYRPSFGSGKGKALVLSFTDTSAQPTYTGTGVEVTQNSCSGLSVTVSTTTNMKKVVFYSSETGNTLVRSFEVSGTTLVGAGNTLNIFPGQHYENLVIDSNNYDSSKGRLITMTQDEGNGNYLSASTVDLPIVNTNLTDENFIGFAAGSYADTATAKVKVVGNTSTQSGLTTAQKYYVKWDGTLSTSPDPQGAPSVTAGRALSSTSLLIQPA